MQGSAEFEGILIALKSIGVPFLVAAVGFMLAKKTAGRNACADDRKASAIAALFAVLAMVGGFAAMNHEQWQFPPQQAMHWMPILTVLPFIVLLPLEFFGAGPRFRLVVQTLMAALAAWVLLPPAVTEPGPLYMLMWLFPITVLWTAAWHHLDSDRLSPRTGTALTLTSGVLGFAVSLGGSITIGSLANSVMGALGAWFVLSLVTGWMPLSRALIGSVVLLLGGVVAAAYFYAEISAVLLATVLLGLFSVQFARLLPDGEEHRRLRRAVIDCLAAAPPLLAAFGFAVWSYLHQASAY